MRPDIQTQETKCTICHLAGQKMVVPQTRTYEIECARCGHYKVTHEAGGVLFSLADELRPMISEWVYEQNCLLVTPTLHQKDVAVIADRPRLSFAERARRLLGYLAARSPFPGTQVDIRDPKIGALLQTYRANAADTVIDYLSGQNLVKVFPPNNAALTGEGLMRAEELLRAHAASTQGFVAMWFDAQLEQAWSAGFEPAIRVAGYEPRRIDKKEHVNKICDEIIAEIRRSRFVVADFTGHRGGVYYEAGYAGGREIPVVWSCRDDYFDALHFDVRQYNCIRWKTPEDLKEQLQARIEAVIGEGPLK